jgi:hypothetical protein
LRSNLIAEAAGNRKKKKADKEKKEKKAVDIPNYTNTEARCPQSRRVTDALLRNRYIRSFNDPVGLSLHAEQQDPSNHDLLSNTLPHQYQGSEGDRHPQMVPRAVQGQDPARERLKRQVKNETELQQRL